MINPNDGKRDPKAPKTYGMAIGASRGMRAGSAGIGQKPPVGKSDADKKKPPLDKSDKIKPEAYKAYILARGKR